jgi:hypothetical protein
MHEIGVEFCFAYNSGRALEERILRPYLDSQEPIVSQK